VPSLLLLAAQFGYPNPNRSHDVSMAVWHTARLDLEQHRDVGWLGRGMDQVVSRPSVPSSVSTFAGSIPNAIRGRRSKTASIESLSEFAQSSLLGQEDVATFETAQSTIPISNFLRQSAQEAYTTSKQLRALSETRNAKSSSALSRLDDPLCESV